MASHTVAGTSSYVDDKRVTKTTFTTSNLSYKWVIKAVLKNLAHEGVNSPSFTVSLPCEDNSSELISWYLNIIDSIYVWILRHSCRLCFLSTCAKMSQITGQRTPEC